MVDVKNVRKFLDQKYPSGTLVHLGKRLLRTKAENDFHGSEGWKSPEIQSNAAECLPETYMDCAGMSVNNVTAKGGTGYVVDEQKVVRVCSESQIGDYRSDMQVRYPELVEKHNGYPVHVINCRTSGAKIDLTNTDKLAFIENEMPDIWVAVFEPMEIEQRLAVVGNIWNQLLAAK